VLRGVVGIQQSSDSAGEQYHTFEQSSSSASSSSPYTPYGPSGT